MHEIDRIYPGRALKRHPSCPKPWAVWRSSLVRRMVAHCLWTGAPRMTAIINKGDLTWRGACIRRLVCLLSHLRISSSTCSCNFCGRTAVFSLFQGCLWPCQAFLPHFLSPRSLLLHLNRLTSPPFLHISTPLFIRCVGITIMTMKMIKMRMTSPLYAFSPGCCCANLPVQTPTHGSPSLDSASSWNSAVSNQLWVAFHYN